MADESNAPSDRGVAVEGGERAGVARAQGNALGVPTVYFIRGADMVKIGKTTTDSIRQRLSMLQTGSPVPLTLIRLVNGGMQAEAWLHRHFAALRAHGEWFKYSDEMLSVAVPAELTDADNGKASARDAELDQAASLWWDGLLNNDAGIPRAEYLEREYQKWAQSPDGQSFLRRLPVRRKHGRPRGNSGVGGSDAAQDPAVVKRAGRTAR